ncbi:MAG: ATP-binding cassette domain-containing protein [Thermomicrobiales bacterium]|nr:ATP-binding cassette domain-containing protein [Thermomicrobiales bacterium]
MIEVQGVCKRYGDQVVVDNISLAIPQGGITAVIGPNGAGKSTLLSLISRLIRLDAGRVTVDGLDITTTPSDELARRLAILRQEHHVESRLTVRDLVSFGRYPHAKGRLTAADQVQIANALAYLDLEPLADRYLNELSGGQRQRAFVAMVLCQDTDYVLLDEPLNSLDIRHAVSMMKRMRQIADDFGKTVVIVLHDINFAACYADRIIAMKDGRVLLEGAPATVMTPTNLQALYDVAVHVEQIGGRPIAVYYA